MSRFAMGISSERISVPNDVEKYAQPIVDFSRISMAMMVSWRIGSPLSLSSEGLDRLTLDDGVSICSLPG